MTQPPEPHTPAEPADLTVLLPDEAATAALGARLAGLLTPPPPDGVVVFLSGELGAGKTCLSRGLLRALGHTGPVRSPTYTLMETYDTETARVVHCDLYRLADPGELEYIGLRELLGAASLVMIEWPQKGLGALPPPDLTLDLSHYDRGRLCRIHAAGAPDSGLGRGLAALAGALEPAHDGLYYWPDAQ